MIAQSKSHRRVTKLYGDVGAPYAKSFVPHGRTGYYIYAVSVADHPGVVKIGRTAKWSVRRVSYANWNLAAGDAIAFERVFTITDEYVDLPKLESAILAACPFPIRHGSEWFAADFEEVARFIDRFLCEAGISCV